LRLPFGPLQRNGLSLMQRSHYLSTVFYWMSLVFLPMWALAPAVYWLFDVPAYHADVDGLLTYQMPSIIVSQAYMIWTARKRLVPLIWEGVQLAFAIDASWAVWAMLFTGKPRTTRSTLKGVSTKRINVRLFGTVAALLGINIVGLIWGQIDARGAIGHVADQVNILWGLYAVLMSGMAALLCVEVPRPRHEQRFTIDEPIALADGGTAVLTDISVSGARLAMANPPEDIEFMWRGIHSVTGKRVRSADGWGSYVFASDKAVARELTVAIYTGGFQSSAVNFNLPRFFSSIGRRLLLNSQPTDRPGPS
jgi:cellulose synthase (UDP-forming)